MLCGCHVDADTLPLLKQQQPLAWSWIFWSTSALCASPGAGDCGALLHSAHQAWSGDSVVRRLEVEALNSTQLHSAYIHTDVFQRKRHLFPGNENHTGSNFRSDNSVSVGPTVRSYARHVPKLRTFFITEFREPGAPWSPANKKSQSFSMEFV